VTDAGATTDGAALRRSLRNVTGDRLASLKRAFEVAAYGIPGHLAGLFQRFAKGANFRNGRREDVVAALRHRFKNRSVAVFSHGLLCQHCTLGAPFRGGERQVGAGLTRAAVVWS